jgi:transposase
MDKAAVGIDVSKDHLDIALLQEEGVIRQARFKNNDAGFAKLEQWLQKYAPTGVHVCLEATGQYGEAVAEYLYQKGMTVSVVNPARIKAYADSKLRRNKTDKLDAVLIADFCARQNPAPWKPIPANVRILQGLFRRLEDLQIMRQQESNRLKSGRLAPAVEEDLQKHLEYLNQRMAEIEKAIQDHIRQDPDLEAQKELLMSIKGIGEKTAYLLLSEIPHLREFEHVNELVAFAGLNPQVHRSGSSINARPRLSKKGSSRIRKGLYFPAVVAKNKNPILKPFAERLLKAGKSKMCVIGAVMRKLLHLVFGVLKSGQPFDPNYRRKLLAAS